MKTIDDNSMHLDLKCDFPARESFREALLARLRTVSPQVDDDADDSRIRELSDSELEMLAAAQDGQRLPPNWPWSQLPPFK